MARVVALDDAGSRRMLGSLPRRSGLGRTLSSTMASTRSATLGPATRPVSVPENLDDPALHKASGRVELPLHVRWSGPPIIYDLNDRVDRARVYEQVLREGTEDDVRYYVDADHLRELFDDLVLPPPVRRAWAAWLERHRRAM